MPIPSSCTLCKAGKHKQSVITSNVYGRKNSAFFKCDNCQVIYQYPQLSEKEEKFFYKKEFEKFMEDRAETKNVWLNTKNHIDSNHETKIRRNKYLKKFISKNKLNILEVGCSSGFMLFDFIKAGHNCSGIEPSGVFSKFLKTKNIKLYENIKQIRRNDKFDLLFHFFVLEHIRNPLKFLKDQIKILKKNGKIIFEIPCYEDALYKIYDIPEFERFYWSVAHPWYFNFFSLEYLLKKTGKEFKIIKEQRYDLSNHLYWMKFKKPGGMHFYSDKIGKKIEEEYKKNLISKGYYDTLVGVIYN
tara:strand:- start:96 stop:998 length:903 start_codon:yes stop_codon:yes gene_type:complete